MPKQARDKTITAGSDASGGMIMGGKPSTQKEKESMIELAMRGLAKGVIESLESIPEDQLADRVAFIEEITPTISESIASGSPVFAGMSDLPDVATAAVDIANVPASMDGGIPAHLQGDEPQEEAVVTQTTLDEANLIRSQQAKAIEPANVPLAVPNYHRPGEETTRICATCKYFRARTAKTGDCYAYSFTAFSDYSCNSWTMAPIETNGVDSDRVSTPEAERIVAAPTPNPHNLPAEYQHIQFYPTAMMSDNAKQALEVRNTKSPSERGCSAYGLVVASRIANRQFLPPDIWRRMLVYFEVHQTDKGSPDWEAQGPSWQGWMAWGGDDGFLEAKNIVASIDEADERQAAQMLNVDEENEAAPAQKAVAREIIQASGPTSEVPGGELITLGDFLPKTAQELNWASPEHDAHDIVPELSKPHGTIKRLIPFYLPGERVYSKTMHFLGDVIKSQVLDNMVIYHIKLVDTSGIVQGSAIVDESDLTPRSMRAVKRMEIKSVREAVEGHMNNVIGNLKSACAKHADLQTNPIDTSELEQIETQVKDVLSSEDFAEASAKMGMRKYVRALQDIEHTVGAAAHILRGVEEMADDPESVKDIELMTDHAQRNAYRRLEESAQRAEECLLDEVPMRSFSPRSNANGTVVE